MIRAEQVLEISLDSDKQSRSPTDDDLIVSTSTSEISTLVSAKMLTAICQSDSQAKQLSAGKKQMCQENMLVS